MADSPQWTPADVRGLVNDVFKWVLLGVSLWLGVDAKKEATEAKAEVGKVRVLMGQAK